MASGPAPTGEGYYEAKSVRPLNAATTDNKLLANDVRLVVDIIVFNFGSGGNSGEGDFMGGYGIMPDAILKITVQGTEVRSDVCNSLC